jgi:tRNA G10  N-methylase Trm11
MRYTNRTKIVGFAEDLVITIKVEYIREAENIANVELSKISAWTKEKNLIQWKKSNLMFMTRRKRKECKELELYL